LPHGDVILSNYLVLSRLHPAAEGCPNSEILTLWKSCGKRAGVESGRAMNPDVESRSESRMKANG